jgi:hypothetical protein
MKFLIRLIFWVCIEVIGLKRSLNETLQEHLDMTSSIHNRDALKTGLLMRNNLENAKQAFLFYDIFSLILGFLLAK